MTNGSNFPGDPPSAGEDAPGLSGYAIPLARPISVLAVPRARDMHPMLLLDEPRGACLVDIVAAAAVLSAVFGTLYVLAHLATPAALDEGPTTAPVVSPLPAELVDEPLTPEQVRFSFVMTLAIGLVAVLIIAGIARVRGQGPASLGLRAKSAGWDLLFAAAATVLCFAALLMGAFIIVLLPGGSDLLRENSERISEQIPPFPPFALSAAFLCVGFYEEFVFRGFLMPRLRRATGSWTVAIIASSALFAVAHLGSQVWVSIIPLFLVGLNLAIFTALRRSLIPAIIGHWLFNFANVMWMRHVLSGGFVAL